MNNTKEYSRFHFLAYNRQINTAHVKKLVKSMKDFGFLVPILTTADGTVLDGQHRLKAAELADVAIDYVELNIPPERFPQAVSVINSSSKQWTLKDYLDLYCDLGNDNYIKFRAFLADSSIPASDGLSIWAAVNPNKNKPKGHKLNKDTTGGAHGSTAPFKEGSFVFQNGVYDEAVKMAGQIKEIRNFHEGYEDFRDSKAFISAVVKIVTTRGYDHERMIQQLSDMRSRVVKAVAIKDYITMLLDVYNHGHRSKLLGAA